MMSSLFAEEIILRIKDKELNIEGKCLVTTEV